MHNDSWKYYNHAMIPDIEPHEDADVSCINGGEIWNMKTNHFLSDILQALIADMKYRNKIF